MVYSKELKDAMVAMAEEMVVHKHQLKKHQKLDLQFEIIGIGSLTLNFDTQTKV